MPSGAGPVNFVKDFGDTAALMLTVASPKASEVEVALRARTVQHAILAIRQGQPNRATLIVAFPASMNASPLERAGESVRRGLEEMGNRDTRLVEGPGFVGIDLLPAHDDKALVAELLQYATTSLRLSELHPDVWRAVVIHDPQDTAARLSDVVGERYSYRELDDYTDTIQRYLQTVPLVSKVTRSGVLPEAVYLDYSQERLASYGLQASTLRDLFSARNITVSGGVLDIQGKNVSIDPSGELKSEDEIGDMVATSSARGVPMYLRDVVDVSRGYQSPPRYLNFITARNADGKFERSRAITLAVQMRPGSQIADSPGAQIDAKLDEVKEFPA